jgi:hypothetical protein
VVAKIIARRMLDILPTGIDHGASFSVYAIWRMYIEAIDEEGSSGASPNSSKNVIPLCDLEEKDSKAVLRRWARNTRIPQCIP